jgi:hypothetical protein
MTQVQGREYNRQMNFVRQTQSPDALRASAGRELNKLNASGLDQDPRYMGLLRETQKTGRMPSIDRLAAMRGSMEGSATAAYGRAKAAAMGLNTSTGGGSRGGGGDGGGKTLLDYSSASGGTTGVLPDFEPYQESLTWGSLASQTLAKMPRPHPSRIMAPSRSSAYREMALLKARSAQPSSTALAANTTPGGDPFTWTKDRPVGEPLPGRSQSTVITPEGVIRARGIQPAPVFQPQGPTQDMSNPKQRRNPWYMNA